MHHWIARGLSSAALVFSAACLGAQQPAEPTRPTLVVFLTIDQMRADYLARFDKQLTGGLARLYHGGAFFANAYQDHAITETAPGHASTMSGRFPRSTGIISNAAGVGDPENPLVGVTGVGASPFRFRGTALIDWMRVAEPSTRSLSLSRKDRGAILPMGRAHTEVYWYSADRFTTSTYYHDTLPAWIAQFNARQLPQKLAGTAWQLLLPPSAYPEPDTIAVENQGEDFVFPHVFPADPNTAARVLPNFPMMDDVTLQAALAGVGALGLGTGPRTDLLAVSLSTTDAVGHAYGPDSRELHDQILRLDRYLGAFLDSLFRMRDSTRVIIALTADHGGAPYPQVHAARTPGATAQFADPGPVFRATAVALAARKLPPSALSFEEGMITADRAAFARAHVDVDSTLRALAAAIRAVPGVGRVDDARTLAQRDTVRDAIARRWYHMISPERPVDLVVSLAPYAYWAGVTYATHGTPNDYDAAVPVLFWGRPFKPGIYREFARVVDMAPTLARVIGVPPLERLDGHVLTAALR